MHERPPSMTVGEALREAEAKLAVAEIEAPRIQSVALLASVLDRDRAGVLARLREELAPSAARRFEELVRRRVAHEPLQYLIGRAGFLDFEVAVGPGVFIPRPETEQLVETALEQWSDEHPLAIDLCTGSGAVAIALARARPDARVLALDVSAVAVAAARHNACRLGVGERVGCVRADLLAAVADDEATRSALGLLVCNPPYAPHDAVVQPEVRDHEPALAWAGGPVGTEVYARLIPEAAGRLAGGRPLVLELGWGQEASVPELLQTDGRWTEPNVDPDFQGIPRVLTTLRR